MRVEYDPDGEREAITQWQLRPASTREHGGETSGDPYRRCECCDAEHRCAGKQLVAVGAP